MQILQNSIVKCINSISLKNDSYNRKDEVTFEKDQLYTISSINISVITIRTIEDSYAKFVLNSKIYDAPQFDKHFEVISNKLSEDTLCKFDKHNVTLDYFDKEKYGNFRNLYLNTFDLGYMSCKFFDLDEFILTDLSTLTQRELDVLINIALDSNDFNRVKQLSKYLN